MADFIEQLGTELAKKVTAEVMKNLRREIHELSKENIKPFFTETEAAELLTCSPQTLYRRRKNGEISFSTAPNGSIIYTLEQLFDYANKTEVVRVGGKNPSITSAAFRF